MRKSFFVNEALPLSDYYQSEVRLFDLDLGREVKGFYAKIVSDSIADNGHRLTTIEARYPRQVHAELLTHRALSRSSPSSRARPVRKMIEDVIADPYVPLRWDLNNPGMQSMSYVHPLAPEHEALNQKWLGMLHRAAQEANELAELGVHKQSANRVMEPFAMHTVIISATQWGNFFAQRLYDDGAAPALWAMSLLVHEAIRGSTPLPLKAGEWHLPYVGPIERRSFDLESLKLISTGRCANVSFKDPDVASADPMKDIERAHKLCGGNIPHLSPWEHVATPDPDGWANLRGWRQLRQTVELVEKFDSSL